MSHVPARRVLADHFLGRRKPQPELTAAERLLEACRIAVEHERRLASVESKADTALAAVAEIKADRDDARRQLYALDPPDRPARDKTMRARVNEAVRSHCVATGADYRETWNKLYREMLYRHSIDAKVRAKNRPDATPLDVIDEAGLMGDLYAVAIEVFAPDARGGTR